MRAPDGTLVEMVKARGSADALQEFACGLTDSLVRKVFRARYVEYSSFDQCRVGDIQAANSYFRGVDAFRVGKWAEAEQQFNQALERDPGMLQAAWELMIAQRFQRKDDGPILHRLLAGRDSLPPFYVALVEAQLTPELHARFDKYQEVVRNYQRASKSLLLYTNEACPRGSAEQKVKGGTVSVMPAYKAPPPPKQAGSGIPNARDLLAPKGGTLKDKAQERAMEGL